MSYSTDLDEYPELVLIREIERRKSAREHGKCDYCGRLPSEPTCKYPKRHALKPFED